MTLSLEDRLAILQLAARYSQAIDYGDVDGWVATFTADGILTDGQRSCTGSEELRDFASDHAAGDLLTRHWTNNHVVDGDGNTATHSSYILIVKMDETPTLVAAGIYHDELKKVDGEWKFVRRQVTKECPT